MSNNISGSSPRVVADFIPGPSGQEAAPRIMSDRLKDDAVRVRRGMGPIRVNPSYLELINLRLIMEKAIFRKDRGSSREDVQNYLQSQHFPNAYEIADFLFTGKANEVYNFPVTADGEKMRFGLFVDDRLHIRIRALEEDNLYPTTSS